MVNKRLFKENLKKARKRKYKTQQEFADTLDRPIETIHKWEQGKTVPEISTLCDICDDLDCDIDFLLGRIEKPTHAIQAACEQTGLSVDAVRRLKEWNSIDDRRQLWSSYISSILCHPDIEDLLNYLSDYFGAVHYEKKAFEFNDPQGAMEAIEIQTAKSYFISHELTSILDDLAKEERLR